MSAFTDDTDSQLNPALLAAYRATDYEVAELNCVLRVGEACPTLDARCQREVSPTAAFVTASNPRSVMLSDRENERRNLALRDRLQALGLTAVYGGVGRGRDGKWPPEKSVLILGISRPVADELATEFEQAAYVWYAEGKATLLISQGAGSTL